MEPSPQWMKVCLSARAQGIRPPRLTTTDLRTFAPRTMLPRERQASEWSDHHAYRCSSDPAVRGWKLNAPQRSERRKAKQLAGDPASQMQPSALPASPLTTAEAHGEEVAA